VRKRTKTGRTTARASVERRHRVGGFIRHVRRGSDHLLLAENCGTKGGALFREFCKFGGYSWISELPTLKQTQRSRTRTVQLERVTPLHWQEM
jgi:hypothetical protein